MPRTPILSSKSKKKFVDLSRPKWGIPRSGWFSSSENAVGTDLDYITNEMVIFDFINGGFHKCGSPKWRVYKLHKGKSQSKIDDLGVPLWLRKPPNEDDWLHPLVIKDDHLTTGTLTRLWWLGLLPMMHILSQWNLRTNHGIPTETNILWMGQRNPNHQLIDLGKL